MLISSSTHCASIWKILQCYHRRKPTLFYTIYLSKFCSLKFVTVYSFNVIIEKSLLYFTLFIEILSPGEQNTNNNVPPSTFDIPTVQVDDMFNFLALNITDIPTVIIVLLYCFNFLCHCLMPCNVNKTATLHFSAQVLHSCPIQISFFILIFVLLITICNFRLHSLNYMYLDCLHFLVVTLKSVMINSQYSELFVFCCYHSSCYLSIIMMTE